MRLKWSELASTQYIGQIEYIAERNFAAALKIQDRMIEATGNILLHPEIGRIGRCDGTREYIIPKTNLVVIYIVRDDTIYIVNIIHTSQDYR